MKLVNDSNRELCPEGTYNAVCVTILDLGTQANEKWGDRRKINIAFEVEEENEDGDRFILYRTYNASLAPKATLTSHLKSWLGIKIEKGEEFDLDEMLGQPGLVTVVHTEGDDGTEYANLDTITSLPKGTKPLKPRADLVSMYLEEGSFDQEVFDNLPDNIQDKIKATDEYKDLMSSRSSKRKGKAAQEEEDEEEDEKPTRKSSKQQSRKAEPAKTAKGKRGR